MEQNKNYEIGNLKKNPEKNQDFEPYQNETQQQKNKRREQEHSDPENQDIPEDTLQNSIENEERKKITREQVETYTHILAEYGISESEIKQAMQEYHIGAFSVAVKPAIALLVLGNIAQKNSIPIHISHLFKLSALSLREVHKGLTQENEIGNPAIFPDIYYHYIENISNTEALDFIESILQMKMYNGKKLYEIAPFLNFKAELLREAGKIEEADILLTDLIADEEEAGKYNPYTVIDYTENLIAKFEKGSLSPQDKKDTLEKIRIYQQKVKDLPLIMHKQTKEAERTLTLAEAKEAKKNLPDLVNGLIHAKLARISYLRDTKQAQKELDFYFGDEYQIIDSRGNESYDFGVMLLSKLGFKLHYIKESGFGGYVLGTVNKFAKIF